MASAPYEKTELRLSVYDMFLYVANATMCIPEQYRRTALQDLAYKLEEWANVTRPELRDVLEMFGEKLDEMCILCNEPLPSWDAAADGEPVCDACSKEVGPRVVQ